MKEEWKDVEGYEGLYKVSNLGRVYGVKFKRIRIPQEDRLGYLRVDLWKANKSKVHYVHRLVAQHFISKIADADEVNHIDGNKHNNIVSNLEWVSRDNNMKHAGRTELLNSKLSNKDVLEIRELYNKGIYRQYELANIYNVSRPLIHAIVKNKSRNLT